MIIVKLKNSKVYLFIRRVNPRYFTMGHGPRCLSPPVVCIIQRFSSSITSNSNLQLLPRCRMWEPIRWFTVLTNRFCSLHIHLDLRISRRTMLLLPSRSPSPRSEAGSAVERTMTEMVTKTTTVLDSAFQCYLQRGIQKIRTLQSCCCLVIATRLRIREHPFMLSCLHRDHCYSSDIITTAFLRNLLFIPLNVTAQI